DFIELDAEDATSLDAAVQKVLYDVELGGGFSDLSRTSNDRGWCQAQRQRSFDLLHQPAAVRRERRQGTTFPPWVLPPQVLYQFGRESDLGEECFARRHDAGLKTRPYWTRAR